MNKKLVFNGLISIDIHMWTFFHEFSSKELPILQISDKINTTKASRW